ncbi:MAG: HNH endonuclease, partial [Bacteroidia bacterium]|nr:HNH endonuclease [Bacteroidia bacterium]
SDERPCVDHIDGCKTNNHHENLRWATHAENCRNQKNEQIARVPTRGFHGIN